VLANDVFSGIDGTSVEGLTLDQAIAKVRGKKGTPVVLTVVRAGKPPFDLRMIRDTIVQPQVDTRDLANGTVRYIRVSAFSDNAASDFTDALRTGLAKGERSVIVDLRDNPGGYVTAARTLASQFIASGPIYWEESADGTQIETDASPGGVATDPGIRVMVLVNKGSASASEIVSGALQDTKRATLIGETTYGKGTIQQWVDLSDNSGGFRLTIAKWLTPDKRWIHQKGLTPDIAIAAGGAATTPTGDSYIDAALKALGAPAATIGLLRAA
jgi:carboxyl-terminal processing protease